MMIDTYSKVVLTGILIFLGFIAFDYKPTVQAQAQTSGGVEMITTIPPGKPNDRPGVFHLQNGKVRVCWNMSGGPQCNGWSN